jgi:HSP20 family protein
MLLRFDPLADFDRITDQLRRATPILSFDATRDDDRVIIYFDVPGVASDDIDLTVEKNELTVTVERRWNDEDKTVITSERPQGTFTRQLMLGDTLDLDGLTADLDQGVLTVTIPVSERSKQRKISVGGGSRGSEAIDTSSTDASDSSESGGDRG